MFKRRKKGPFLELQLLDSTRMEAKLKRSKEVLGTPVRKNVYVFPISDTSVVDRALDLGIEVEEIPSYVRVVPSEVPAPAPALVPAPAEDRTLADAVWPPGWVE